jgi:hypothetical protein
MTQYPPPPFSAIVVERVGVALNYEFPRATTTGRERLPKLFNVSVPDLKSPLFYLKEEKKLYFNQTTWSHLE